MKSWKKAPILGAAVLLVALAAVPAIAAGSATAQGIPATAPYGLGLRIGPLVEKIAAFLHLTPEALQAERQSGSSLADVAVQQGVEREDLKDTMIQVHEEAINARVEAGTLTQEQADAVKAAIEARVDQRIDNTSVGPMGGASGLGRGRNAGGQGGMAGQGRMARFGQAAPVGAPTVTVQ